MRIFMMLVGLLLLSGGPGSPAWADDGVLFREIKLGMTIEEVEAIEIDCGSELDRRKEIESLSEIQLVCKTKDYQFLNSQMMPSILYCFRKYPVENGTYTLRRLVMSFRLTTNEEMEALYRHIAEDFVSKYKQPTKPYLEPSCIGVAEGMIWEFPDIQFRVHKDSAWFDVEIQYSDYNYRFSLDKEKYAGGMGYPNCGEE